MIKEYQLGDLFSANMVSRTPSPFLVNEQDVGDLLGRATLPLRWLWKTIPGTR